MADDTISTNQTGQQFGNYRLLRLLALSKGTSIYLSEHVHLKTQATVSLYQLRLPEQDQPDFLTESRGIARLIHSHIVRVLEFGVQDDIPFVVMPRPAGSTLRDLHPAGSLLPVPLILSYIRQAAAAIDYAHSQHVLHLDLKPENMWVGRDHELLLSGFRFTLFSFGSRSESIEGIMETVVYMAPEQIQGQPCPASDQYALGIIVYEWLCGFHPFPGKNYIEIAQQHLQASPPQLAGEKTGIPPAVERVVLRALAKDPGQRFPSVQAFADALEQSFFASAKSAHYTNERLETLPTLPLSASERIPASSERAGRHLPRRAVALGLAGLAGAAAVGGGITWFVRTSTGKQPQNPGKPAKAAPPGTTFFTYSGHSDVVYAVAWARDGQNIASWGRDDTMQVWNATTFAPIRTYSMASILSWSPDWRYIASGGATGGGAAFQLWEVATGRILLVHDVPLTGAGGPADLPVNTFVQWSPDGSSVVSTFFPSTSVWTASTGKLLFSYPPATAAWSPDGKRLALQDSNSSDNSAAPLKVQVLDVANENQLASYNIQGDGILWSPDGRYLASNNGKIWSATTGKLVISYQGKSQQTSLLWSPDSKYLALFDGTQYFSQSFNQQQSGKVDPTVRIWSASTGDEVFVYRAHSAGVNYVAWSPDSTKIASASADKTVKVWQVVAE